MSSETTPPPALRFVVATGSSVESGTTLAYLIETTGSRIEKIYFDTMEMVKRPPVPTPPARWFSDRSVFLQHLGLCQAMPRHYLFTVLSKIFGISRIEMLAKLGQLSPALLRLACGFEVPASPSRRPLLCTLASVAQKHGIPLVRTPSLNSEETIADMAADAADVVLGLGTRILSAKLLATARLGFLNAHSSLLPDYRGGATEFWQLAGGERETGVTIHWMAPQVDEGPLCAQKSWPIPRGFDHHRLRLLSFFERLELWRNVIERLMRGEVPRLPQRESRTPTFKAPTTRQEYDFYCRPHVGPRAALLADR